MKTTRAFLFLTTLCFCNSLAIANAETKVRNFSLDDGTTRFVCEGKDVTLPAWGRFGTLKSSLSIDPKDLSHTRGGVEILMLSVRTDDSAWDTMFRRAGFLEIDEFPTSRFVIEKVEGKKLKPNRWVPLKLHGHFTLHGVTKKIVVPATAKWVFRADRPRERERVIVRANFHIKWSDYDIAMPYGSTRLFSGDGANIQVELKFKPNAVKRKR